MRLERERERERDAHLQNWQGKLNRRFNPNAACSLLSSLSSSTFFSAIFLRSSMADPNPCSSSSPPPAGFTIENDDISTILHTLLQSSSLPSSSFASLQTSQQHHQQPAVGAADEIRQQFCRSAAFADSAGVIDSTSGFIFNFQGDCYAPGEIDRSGSVFSGAMASSVEGIGDFDCESEKDQVASEVPGNPAPTRSSSKRSRVAEFHNLSEKRRRQRINEKMKALQKLIPNSNKTDKASMLEEAIDYLKQLQLQVQMLAMRNGSSLYPFYMPGLHSAQPNPTGICFNEEQGLPSSNRGIGSSYANQETSMRTVYNPADQCASSDQKIFMPFALDAGKSERPFSLEPSTSAHCRPFNFTMSSKELSSDSKLQHLQLDVNRCGDESSSGVSS